MTASRTGWAAATGCSVTGFTTKSPIRAGISTGCSHERAGRPAPCLRRDGRRDQLQLSARRLAPRSEEHTSELQSLMRISYAVFCLKKNNKTLVTALYIYN